MDKKELFFTVNPVFATAKGCLGLLKHTGLKEAEALSLLIDTTVKGSSETPPEVAKAYMVSNEARYHIGNIMAKESGCDVIVDLPCGYVPRGLVITEAGKEFYGFDLPAVVEELEPAIRSIATEKQNNLMHFCAVDATNYESMKKALCQVNGKICILTDGLLGYFNEPELDSVCENIHKLLSEYGGIWVTADKFSRELGAVTFTALTDSDGEIIKNMMQKGGTKLADIPINHTVIQDGSVDDAVKYFEDHGFDIKTAAYADKLPELSSLQNFSEEMDKLRKAYKDIIIWIMSARSSEISKNDKSVKSESFNADFSYKDGKLLCRLSGRLDTITAPELLVGFKEFQTDNLKEITLDMRNTEYISSAGLRVLLILYKSLPNSGNFHVRNISEDVMSIFELTGFDNILGLKK